MLWSMLKLGSNKMHGLTNDTGGWRHWLGYKNESKFFEVSITGVAFLALV